MPNMTFEDAVVAAMVQAFLQPVIGGTSVTPDGKEQVWWTQPPAWDLLYRLYERRKDELLAKVTEAIDLDVLAEKTAQRVLSELAEMPTSWGWRTSGANLQDELRRRVVDKLAEAKVAELLAETEKTDGPGE